ncbi:recombinase family protein, partial [Okeania sp. SIO2G5]|uniref:recombinase family protein n=1 Tax=Okeania sp. SIO2G5 TaxID=2607796 RepID=UPI0013C11A87
MDHQNREGRQADGSSTGNTLAEWGEWGNAIDRVYRDWGDRTAFGQLLQDIDTTQQRNQQNTIQVIVKRLGALGDSIAEVGDRIQQLEQRNIDLVILENPDGSALAKDLDTAEQFNAFHRLQTEQRRRALQRGHARNRLKLKPPPGKPPYGYRRGKDRYILDRSTAPVVKDFFDNFLLYGSLRRSVRYLAQKYNKKISVSTGKRWLTNPVYRGHLAYKTGDVITNTH